MFLQANIQLLEKNFRTTVQSDAASSSMYNSSLQSGKEQCWNRWCVHCTPQKEWTQKYACLPMTV